MSNEVLARVNKIQRNVDNVKSGESRRCATRNTKRSAEISQQQSYALPDTPRQSEDESFLFGSISPRCANTHTFGEIESPDNTQRDTTESDNNISSSSTLDIVNKVEHLSLTQLETKVRELTQCLQNSEEQRSEMQRKMQECNAEKELCIRQLDVVSAAHECRITEMHCVIAELSKKLRAKQESTILEEQEPEGSEISFQDGSVYNSELNLTNPDAECQTDPLDADDCSYSAAERFECDDVNLCVNPLKEIRMPDNVNKGQVEALQEEVFHLKAQIALLQSEIAESFQFKTCAAIEEQQKIEYFAEDYEANESNCSSEQLRFANNKKAELNDLDFMATLQQCEPVQSPQKAPPIAKMAERVKLRCATKTMGDNVTATDLLNKELKNASIVEHLVSDLKLYDNMLESFVEPAQLSNELQRLQRKVEHLQTRNTVLSLTLDECKEHCEHLYLLCGKYESNAIALQSAVNCSDRAIEAYDVMLALLESKLALIKEESVSAEESRKAVEVVARHLLDRLESEKNVCENSLGPWQNSFSIPDKACGAWTADDDSRLRYHVSKLKGRRSTVQNTIVNLESPFSDFYEKSRLALESSKEYQSQEKGTQLDLEMAVLMQELLNLREENISLKSKLDVAEKEQKYAGHKAQLLEDALKQLQQQLAIDSNTLFSKQSTVEKRVSYSEAEHAALTEQQLVESLSRESELKGRIQTLIASVTASQKLADEKQEQLQSNLLELQRNNMSLSQLLEQTKRKYQLRVRKLEQRLLEMSVEMRRQLKQQQQSVAMVVQPAQMLKYKGGSCSAKSSLHSHDNVPETTL